MRNELVYMVASEWKLFLNFLKDSPNYKFKLDKAFWKKIAPKEKKAKENSNMKNEV